MYLCNKALSEISILSRTTTSKDELDVLNSPPFQFYRVTLQYCFNAEYTKLLESKKNDRFPNNHIASIIHLNTTLRNSGVEDFDTTFSENEEILYILLTSGFYAKMQTLRDKKFSHTDLDEPMPQSIQGLTDEEIEIGFSHLRMMYTVINNCAKHFDFTVQNEVPSHDARTDNFIRYHAKYKTYYHKHYLDALKRGYGLND